MARQTPQQKRANERHAKSVEKQMGKPESAYKKKESFKSPLSPLMTGVLIFVVIGTLGLGLGEVGGALFSWISRLFSSSK